MLNKNARGRLAPLLGGIVATSMLTFTAGAASGVEAGNAGNVNAGRVSAGMASTATSDTMSNEFGSLTSDVMGTFGKNGSGTVTGTFEPRRFTQDGGQLMAVGLLTATLTRPSGRVEGTESQVVTLPVMSAEGMSAARVASRAAACDILHLVLGPLDLDVLGLKVHLDKVVLNIDAEPGPGNLLGNLLCAVAGLLDNTGLLTQVRQILNSVLAILKL
jgi:hypothetical protein